MLTVVLYAILIVKGHEPIIQQKEVGSVQECIEKVSEILQRPTPPGSVFQAGCSIAKAPE